MNYGLKDSGKREEFSTGSRRDTREGKGRFDLISPYAERRLALVLEKGAVKYGERNWELGQQLGRYLDSALRHINCIKLGMHDEDHAAQAMWNLHSFIHTAEMIEQGKLPNSLDDIGYVPTDEECNCNVPEEPARPEQSDECQCEPEQCPGVCGYTPTLPPAGRQVDAAGTAEPGCSDTLHSEAPEDGAPALWWYIRDYLESNGPQNGDHMWNVVARWGDDDYFSVDRARIEAGVTLEYRNTGLYWCLENQLPFAEEAF